MFDVFYAWEYDKVAMYLRTFATVKPSLDGASYIYQYLMKNKGIIVALTLVVSLLCVYYLSLTLISRDVERKAEAYSIDALGVVDYQKKQAYLDSLWSEPVWNFLGMSVTYKELKETELNLGLDLQGGMHVVLEVSPKEIVHAVSQYSKHDVFKAALQEAEVITSQNPSENFVDVFYASFKKSAPNVPLREIFYHVNNKDKIGPEATDEEIVRRLNVELEDALDRSFNILRARLDKFGASQPSIQKLPGKQHIQVELPGVDNPERVKKILQNVAKLSFYKVNDLDVIVEHLDAINDMLVAKKAKERREARQEKIKPKSTTKKQEEVRSKKPERGRRRRR